MKRQCIRFFILITIATGIFLGSNFPVIKNSSDDPAGNKENKYNSRSGNHSPSLQIDNFSINNQISGSAYYSDNFDGSNDTTSLKNRGYKVYYRGGGFQGVAPVWFQGNFFLSFNGPSTGYLAANYQVLSSINNIDSWLVLPGKNISSGDSIAFYSRSDSASIFPDSIRVMYSPAGDSVPESAWTELGRFKVNISGIWERKAFGVSTPGANARYAIRYNIVNAGPGGVNGNYIGIDALTLESNPGPDDISAVSVISPSGNISLPVSNIAPKATYKNIGTTLQTNIPVTFKITGPVNYTSNKIIASLAPNATVQVIFDSTFNPSAAGNYSVSAFSSLFSDGNRFNDTIKSALTSVNTNYGDAAGYYYANSTTESNPAPSKPQFCWKDTTGSINLALNTVNMNPGISTGDLDDGYWKILLPSGKKVRFFGNNYDTIRIGTNGIIAFQSFVPNSGNWNPPDAGIPGGSVLNAVYPLWYDFDFSDNTAASTSRISYKIAGDQIIVTYDRAPVYSGNTGEYVSFQVAMDISNSPATNSRISIEYSDTASGRTGAQFINLVNSNTLGKNLIGLQNNSGTSAFTYRFRNSSTLVTPGKIFNSPAGSLALQMGPDATKLNSGPQTLSINSRLQVIQLLRKDTLSIYIKESIPPYPVIEMKKVVYDSVSGTSTIPLTLANNGASYYLYISHRNSISTWSAAPVACNSNLISYNFTTGISQAYASNMIVVGGKASFFTGDVSYDSAVDLTDMISIQNKSSVFTSGNYLLDDLNYDGIVDLTDLIGAYNNVTDFVAELSPPGAGPNTLFAPEKITYERDIMPEPVISKKEWKLR
jgi:hypothetical protein